MRIEPVEVLRHADDLGADLLGHPARELLREARFVLVAREGIAGAALGRRHQFRERAAVAQAHADLGGGGQRIACGLDLVVELDGGALLELEQAAGRRARLRSRRPTSVGMRPGASGDIRGQRHAERQAHLRRLQVDRMRIGQPALDELAGCRDASRRCRRRQSHAAAAAPACASMPAATRAAAACDFISTSISRNARQARCSIIAGSHPSP